jgi:hypothetical protein
MIQAFELFLIVSPLPRFFTNVIRRRQLDCVPTEYLLSRIAENNGRIALVFIYSILQLVFISKSYTERVLLLIVDRCKLLELRK